MITDHQRLGSLGNQCVYGNTKANRNDKLIIGKSRKNDITYLIWHTLIVKGNVHNTRDGNGTRHGVGFIKSRIASWVARPLIENTGRNIEPPLGVALAVLSEQTSTVNTLLRVRSGQTVVATDTEGVIHRNREVRHYAQNGDNSDSLYKRKTGAAHKKELEKQPIS